MNIMFFLLPKSEVAYIDEGSTLRQVMETMEHHRYSSIPVLNKQGEYVGTITEGDVLWGISELSDFSMKISENILIRDFDRHVDYAPVRADADMEDLIQKAMDQNFVPVVDDQDKFIGIITRKSIIEYCYDQMNEKEADPSHD